MRNTIWFLLLFGCSGGEVEGIVQIDTSVEDTVGPVIQHSPITEPQIYGQEVWLEASAVDAQGSVWVVLVEYQAETANAWSDMPLHEVGGGLYQGRINGSDVWSGGMRYFIRAIDELGNESCLPDGCDTSPWHFSVVPD